MAPNVQSLADVIAELNPAYAQSQAVIQQKQAGLGAKYDAQRAGITAEKGQAFNAINNQATGRGASFSGIPLDEQATYLSTKYLPGLQTADYQQNEEGLELEGQNAQIETQKYGQAFNSVERQKSDLNSWNMAEAQRAAQAREAELQRQFQASEGAADRAASAANSAASRAPTGPTNAQIIGNLNSWASSRVGGDKKLSPSDFKAGYQEAAALGMDPDTYVAVMQRYINNSHAADYDF